MTRKEFLTNLVRGLGYDVLSYTTGDPRQSLIEIDTCQVISAEWSRSRTHKERVTLKLICLPFPFVGDYPLRYCTKARDLVNRANAFLRERGLEGVADWYDSPTRRDWEYLRIRSIEPIWNQAAKHLTNDEVLSSPRYKDCGNILEDSQE